MPRAKKTETIETQAETVTPTETEIAQAIAGRYYGCIKEIAPAIASEFWNRLDGAVAAEILKQRPGGSDSTAPKFLSGIGESLAQVDVTTRAIASGGGAI